MQRAVERDAQTVLDYAMCPVNPSRISKTFTTLHFVKSLTLSYSVEHIAWKSSTTTSRSVFLLESFFALNILLRVNKRLRWKLVALQTMTNVLNYLKVQRLIFRRYAFFFS